ncbi:phospholipase A2 [Rhodococcus sp. H36-A4]|uniref:phospholipase A2 n=1 Tax=Rhodococcus sp. H36-A4 TaxID=3004353 RepID=UPI0022B0655C|nr:phospholipase A2 [Rhodococcus sp. H36-A4]MCZ4078415.1 phospholipase A2 [Rhodococcus sp. H36-A4]
MKQTAETPSETRRANHLVTVAAVCAALAASVAFSVPTASADAPSGSTIGTETTIAIEALTMHDAADAASKVPPDFGYSPTIEHDLLVNPAGSCSSPVPLPDEFESACAAHDLGYDLLRHGAIHGNKLPASARRSLDSMLAADMHAACAQRTEVLSRAVCDGMAEVAASSVRLNSWRQHDGTPIPEPALPFLLAGAVGTSLSAAALGALSLYSSRRARQAVSS